MGKGSVFGSPINIDCSEYKHVGTHRLDGIFMAMGDIIRQGEQIRNAQILDLAPTILYMLGQPIPDDMDGRVLIEILKEEFLQKNPPRYDRSRYDTTTNEIVAYSDEESQNVAEMLKGLGYLE